MPTTRSQSRKSRSGRTSMPPPRARAPRKKRAPSKKRASPVKTRSTPPGKRVLKGVSEGVWYLSPKGFDWKREGSLILRRWAGKKPKQTFGSRREVWTGRAKKTSGGLTIYDIGRNARGRLVSKRKHRHGLTIGVRKIQNSKYFGNPPKRHHKKGGADSSNLQQQEWLAYQQYQQEMQRSAPQFQQQPQFAAPQPYGGLYQ